MGKSALLLHTKIITSGTVGCEIRGTDHDPESSDKLEEECEGVALWHLIH